MIDFFTFYTASLLWNVGNGEDIVLRGDCAVAHSLGFLPCLLIVCGRARDPHDHQRDGSRIDLSIRRDGSKQNFWGIIALERSVFFL
jgi:hypothetical protein